ncbi:MAG TPA: hypothetical protein EYN54_11965 [Methylococcaceae bacterium]|nr:hypothetical protein [Methylococcaceae bacterium]
MKGRHMSLGDHWVISDISGFKYPASEMMKLTGDQAGLLVHRSEWNPAHPQLKIHPRKDDQTVKNVRLRPVDSFPAQITQDDL